MSLLIKILKHEAIDVAKITAERLNLSVSEVTLLIRQMGSVKIQDQANPSMTRKLTMHIDTLLKYIKNPNIKIKFVDCNLNEKEFELRPQMRCLIYSNVPEKFRLIQLKEKTNAGLFGYPFNRFEQLNGDYLIATYLVWH